MTLQQAEKNTVGANSGDLREHAHQAEQLLKAVSNANRLMILCALIEDEHSVGDLSVALNLSMSAISQHLSTLKKEGFVSTRRDAQTIYYSLQEHPVRDLMACLHKIYCEPN